MKTCLVFFTILVVLCVSGVCKLNEQYCVECDPHYRNLRRGCTTVTCDEGDPEGACYECPISRKYEKQRNCWKCFGRGCRSGLYFRVVCPSNRRPGFCFNCSRLQYLNKKCWVCHVKPTELCQAVSCQYDDEDGTCYKNCDSGTPKRRRLIQSHLERRRMKYKMEEVDYAYDEPNKNAKIYYFPIKNNKTPPKVVEKKLGKFHYTQIRRKKPRHFFSAPVLRKPIRHRKPSILDFPDIFKNASFQNMSMCYDCPEHTEYVDEECLSLSCFKMFNISKGMVSLFFSHFNEEDLPDYVIESINLTTLHNPKEFQNCYQCPKQSSSKYEQECKRAACSRGIVDLYNALYSEIEPNEFLKKLDDPNTILTSRKRYNNITNPIQNNICYQCPNSETPKEGGCNEISCGGKLKEDLNSACFKDHKKVNCGVDCISCTHGVQSVCNFVPCRPGDQIMTCYGVCKDWSSI